MSIHIRPSVWEFFKENHGFVINDIIKVDENGIWQLCYDEKTCMGQVTFIIDKDSFICKVFGT